MKKYMIIIFPFILGLLLFSYVSPVGRAHIPVNASIYDDVTEKGWIGQDEFVSDALLTRAQAIKTIMRMSTNLPDIQGYMPDFNDTKGHPDIEFIRKARNYGIVSGGKSNAFSPERPVTKETLIIWMNRVFYLPDTVNFENDKVKDNNKKSDSEAYYAINKFIEHKIITVDGKGDFHPRSTLTIGEFASIIDRLSGVGIKDLEPIKYEGQKQKEIIIEPH